MKHCFSFVVVILLSVSLNAQRNIQVSDAILKQLNSRSSSITQSINSNFSISDAYTDKSTGLGHLYLQQVFSGIKVFNSIKSVVTHNDSVLYQSGDFNNFTSQTDKTPSITAENAINNVAVNLSLQAISELKEIENRLSTENKIIFNAANIAKQNITAELVWFPNESTKSLQLAWNISIDVLDSPDFWLISVDAHSGEILGKCNYTVYENNNTMHYPENDNDIQSNDISKNLKDLGTNDGSPLPYTSNFNVIPFPNESRFAGAISQVSNPWTLTGNMNANATTYGWNYDGDSTYAYTRGNNAFAYIDSAGLDKPGIPANSTTQSPTLNFNATPDFTLPPYNPINRDFASSNLFYWNNIMHDIFYQYGFDEAAGNFQQNNLGRGGIGGDYVKAEAQYGNGSGTYVNNANFTTPVDGLNGLMRMYLYNPIYGNLTINSPSSISGVDTFREGKVSPYNYLRKIGPISGQLVLYNDDAAGTVHNACAPPTNNVAGKIVFIYSTGCNYAPKIKAAQNAGAIAVLVGRANGPAVTMGGTDSSITIPAVMVSTTDGNKIAASLSRMDSVAITLTSGIHFDGAIDNSINTHEYTHGISIRLTGGPSNSSCLNNKERGSEGWSDYVAAMVTTNWANIKISDSGMIKYHGAYADNQIPGGVGGRVYPYTTNMTIDPHTYTDLANTTYAGEVHYIGEVWCSVLWDMTWNIIKQEAAINPLIYDVSNGGGNVIALQLVINGLKLQKCSPGFLDARNAILAADSILFNYKHKCAIWSAFARRGMGLSAVQGSSNSTTDQVAAYDVPGCTLPLHLVSFTGSQSGNHALLNWKTIAEFNTQSFIIQYATNGKDWTDVDTISSKHLVTENDYSVLINNLSVGENYFRLKMVDKGGSFSYSNMVSISFEGNSTSFLVYPNPAKNGLSVQLNSNSTGKAIVQVTDMAGKVLKQVLQKNSNQTIPIDIANLSSGSYILVVKGDKEEKKIFIKE